MQKGVWSRPAALRRAKVKDSEGVGVKENRYVLRLRLWRGLAGQKEQLE